MMILHRGGTAVEKGGEWTMPQYTRQDGDAMRQDAIRRSKEMYHRATIPQPTPQRNYDFLPLREDSAATSGGMKKSPLDLGNLLGGWNPAELLEHLDKDQILILVLLVMLYKEGGDKKLMMALAYLLT